MGPTVESFCEKHGAKPLFDTHKEYEEFCKSFSDEVRPALEENRQARINSEEMARKDLI